MSLPTEKIYLTKKAQDKLDAFIIEAQVKVAYTGWGCGYVALPKDHELYGKDADHIGYNYHMPATTEITYTKEQDLGGEIYWVVGFDTYHIWNDTSNDKKWVIEQTLELREALQNLKRNEREDDSAYFDAWVD